MDMARTAADAQDAERAAPAQAQKQILFEAADALEDQPAAEAMVSGYDGGADAGEYARAFTQIYQAARAGLDMDQIAGALDEDYTPTVISQTAAMRAYYLGQNQYRARTTAQVETAGITPQTETAGEYRPGVRLSVAQPDALSASERGQIELMDRIGRKYGVEIEVADSLRGGEANGIYDPSAGRIIVARDAESGMMMAAAMHEMGHFIADWSPDEWVQLSDYVTNTLRNQGVDVDARVEGIKAQYENAGVAYDGQIGMDELVCNALPAILSDSGNVTRLAGERPRLAAKMREFIVNLAGQIRKMITALKNAGRPEAEAAARDVENLEIIADLFSASLEGAGHNRAQAEAAAQSAAAGAARAGAADGRSAGETSAQSDGAKQVDADGLRYSLKDTQDAQVDHLMEEREIAAAVNAVEDLGRAVNAAAHLDTDRLKKLAASEAARLKRESKSTYDRATLEDNLLKLYTYLNQPDAKWRQAIRSASDIALGVINGSALKDSALFDEYAALRARLRQTKIRLNSTQRAEVENQYGSYNDYRKANFGRINLVSQGGISLDSLWVDLSEAYPQLFDADTNDAAQPAALMDALESIRPQYINPYGMGETEAALDMALEIMGRYGTGAVRGIEAAAVKTARAQLDKRIDAARQTARKEYDARLRAVRAKNIEARQALARKVRRETRESERKKYEKKYLELARRQTGKLAEQRAKVEKARENQALTQRRKKVRGRIEKSAGALARMLESGANANAVPDFLRGTIVRALESIDLSPGERNTIKGETWKARISALRDEVVRLDRAQDGEDASGRYADLYMTLDPDTVGALDAVVESMGKAGVNTLLDMDEQALESLSDALSAIRRGLETIGQTWANERYSRVEDLGRATMRDMSGKKTKKARAGIAAQLDNLLNIDQLDSFSFFGALGPAAQSVQKAIAHGQEQVFARVREMAEILDADPAMGKNRGKRAGEWKRKTHTVKLDSGQEIKISAAQAMELYNLMRRPQAAEHILTGGIRLEDIDAKGGRVRQPFTARITMEDAAKIADLLTAEQKAAAESMQRHLSGTVAGWGNEVSQKMYLYDKFKEKPYWPIRTDRDYGRTSDPDRTRTFNAIRNSGFTKALTPHAKNPVLIGDAYDTFSQHVGQMAAYNGLAMPIDDALKWLSYADREIVEGESRYTGSVKQALRRAMGERAQQYIVNLIKDVNGLSSGSYGTELASGLVGNMKAAAVAGNLRVVVQQPTAIVRAAAMINPKYLLAAVAKKHDMAEMRAHSPIAWWKSMGGGVDIGTGKSMRKLLIGDGTTRENILEAAMKPAGMADDITWSHLWSAVKLEIEATRSDLEKGSDEYFEAVNRRFTDIVDQTQVVDTVLHRSQLMRSKDGLIKMATAFMSEPTKTYNMMRNAIVDMADKKPGAKRRLTVTTAAIVGSTALTAAVKGLYDALRYRKEEDDFVKLWQENMTKSLAEDLNPLGIVPFAKDLLALIEGQDVERTDMSGIASFVQAVTQTYTHFYGGGTKKTDYQVIANLIKEAGSLRGLPLKGIMNSVETFVNGLIAPGFTRGVSTSDEVYGRLLELTRLGDARAAAMRDGLKTQARTLDGKAYNEYGLAVKTEKEIDVGLAGAMLSDETVAARIAQAYQARMDTDTRTLRAIRRGLMDELNVSGEIVDKAINLYANQAEAEQAQPQDEKTDEPLKERLYDAQDLSRAIMAAAQGGGGQTDIQDIKAELVADSEAADPEKSVKSMASSEIKPLYIKAYDDGDTALCGRLAGVLIDNFGFEQEDMDGWVKSSLRERLYAAIDGGDMAEAERQIEKLKDDFGMEDTDLMSSLNSKYRDAYRSAYFGGREAEAEALISRLNALGLRNKSGQAGWNDSWLKKYWQKPDED